MEVVVTLFQQHLPVLPLWQSGIYEVYTNLGLFGFFSIIIFIGPCFSCTENSKVVHSTKCGVSLENSWKSWKQVEKGEKKHSGLISRLNVCVYIPASSHELGV